MVSFLGDVEASPWHHSWRCGSSVGLTQLWRPIRFSMGTTGQVLGHSREIIQKDLVVLMGNASGPMKDLKGEHETNSFSTCLNTMAMASTVASLL